MSLVAFALPITILNGGSPSKSLALPAACIFSKITLPDLLVTLTQVCSEKDMLTFLVAAGGTALLASPCVTIATGLLAILLTGAAAGCGMGNCAGDTDGACFASSAFAFNVLESAAPDGVATAATVGAATA